MYLDLGRIRVHVTFPFAVFVAFLCNTAAGERLVIVFVSALLHECVHLIFLIGYGCRDICLTLNPGGASIRCSGLELLGVKRSLMTLLSAPAANCVTGALLCCAAAALRSETLYSAALVNLSLGGINLLPLPFADGGRALAAILSARYAPESVKKATECCGRFCLLGLCAVTAALMMLKKSWGPTALFTLYSMISVYGEKVRAYCRRKALKKQKKNDKIYK